MMAWAEEIGVSYTDEDEKIKEMLVSCVLKQDIKYVGLSDLIIHINREEYKCFDLDYLGTYNHYLNKNEIENTFLLFNLLFPGTYLYETGEHYETSFEYYDDTYDGEEEFAPRLIEGEFDLDVYDPERMEKEAFVVETSEATDVGGGSNGCDTYVRKSPVVSPLTLSNPDKEFLSRVIEQSTAKGYTELTALLLGKCKDI
jgi:hypothetical protein